jgi:hypothetical protein
MIFCKILVQPDLDVPIFVEANHVLSDLECSNFAVAVIEPSNGLGEHVDRLLKRQIVQIGGSDGYTLCKNLEYIPIGTQIW